MKNKDMFIEALSTLFYSWGSDTPHEAVWAANEFLKWYEAEYNVKLNIKFSEEDGNNYDEVIEAINKA